MTARNFKEMWDNNEIDYIRLQKDKDNQDLNKELATVVSERRAELEEGYTPELKKTDLYRVEAKASLEQLQKAINSFAAPQFGPEDYLDTKASARVSAIKNLIKKMTDSARSEKMSQAMINSLYMAHDADKIENLDPREEFFTKKEYRTNQSLFGRRYISKENAVFKDLWALYYNTAAMNYVKVLTTTEVNDVRSKLLTDKLQKFIDEHKLQGPALMAAMNLLEQNK